MALAPGIGVSDFRELRSADRLYVDKSRFISDVLRDPWAVLLFPRPRRFGKTVNLSMLRYFVERRDEDLRDLFSDLEVWGDAEAREHFGRYPVIFVTFKEVKGSSFEDTVDDVRRVVSKVYEDHRYLLDGSVLSPEQIRLYRQCLAAEAGVVATRNALQELSEYLARYHESKVFVLIDEYDAPIHNAYLRGFYEPAIDFFRGLYSALLKDNDRFVFRGVLTGILRVARESMLSGLNNLAVRSILEPAYATSFGFTDEEVERLLAGSTLAGRVEEVRASYGGYRFGGQHAFNPWSVLSAIAEGRLDDYWASTGSTGLLRKLLTAPHLHLSAELDRLLAGETANRTILEDLPLRDLDAQPDAVWSFLLMSGYLTPAGDAANGRTPLAIPNREARRVFQDVFRSWLERSLGEGRTAAELRDALLSGDAAAAERLLGALLVNTMSYYNGHGEPETFYHGISLGLSFDLEASHLVRSNRESGHGRADLLLIPRQPGEPGVVIELKVAASASEDDVEQALADALRQISEHGYTAELEAAGAEPIHALAVAFAGKRVWVRRGSSSQPLDYRKPTGV